MIGKAVEDLRIVVDSDPLDEALEDVLVVDGLDFPGSSGDFVELDEDGELLRLELVLGDFPELLVDDQPGVVDFDCEALEYLEVVVEVLVIFGVGGREGLEKCLELLFGVRGNVDVEVGERECEIGVDWVVFALDR